MNKIRIGVLALQGDFSKHADVLRSLGVDAAEVRKPQDLADCDGLILPGGESTAMIRQIEFIELRQPLLEFAKHKPLFGTCAGLILLSNHVQGGHFEPFNLLDVSIERNAFGRQAESFQTFLSLHLKPGHTKTFQAIFIRAPRIRTHGEGVQVLAEFNGEPVLVRQGNFLGAAFHPELTADPAIHEYFLDMITS